MAVPDIIGGIRETYRTIQRHGSFTESPWERLHELAFNLFSSRELPNIILGGAISSTIAVAVGSAPLMMAALAWAAWLVSVVNYMLAQEVVAAYRAASRRFEDEPRGIY